MSMIRHNVRFKGVILGEFTAAEIAERVRAGELNLAHVVRRRDRWVTLRQFLQESEVAATTEAPSAAGSLLSRLTGRMPPPPPGGEAPPPPPGASSSGDPLESRVREGYLWCGLTFLMPAVIGLPIWGLCQLAGLKSTTLGILWSLFALGGAGYAAWRAHLCAQELRDHGLEDVGQSMRNLALGLAALSSLFWVLVALKWTNG